MLRLSVKPAVNMLTPQVELQKKDFVRIFGDWDNPYLTMNFQTRSRYRVHWVQLQKHGHINQVLKTVNWCLDCGSALAEAEVEYEDKKSDAIDVGFAVVDLKKIYLRLNMWSSMPTDIVIWTTPWTPANQAVAFMLKLNTNWFKYAPNVVHKTLFCQRFSWISNASVTNFENPVLADFNGSAWKPIIHPLPTIATCDFGWTRHCNQRWLVLGRYIQHRSL